MMQDDIRLIIIVLVYNSAPTQLSSDAYRHDRDLFSISMIS